MTTNMGAHLIQEKLAHTQEEHTEAMLAETKAAVTDMLQKAMRPEFLNRIDEVIMFKPLTKDIIRRVVDIQLQQLQRLLQQNGVALLIQDALLDYLGREGYNPQFGARPLKRLLQRVILNALSKALLANTIDKAQPIQATLAEGGHVVFENVEAAAASPAVTA